MSSPVFTILFLETRWAKRALLNFSKLTTLGEHNPHHDQRGVSSRSLQNLSKKMLTKIQSGTFAVLTCMYTHSFALKEHPSPSAMTILLYLVKIKPFCRLQRFAAVCFCRAR